MNICPRCKTRPRIGKKPYCNPCGAEYNRERRVSQEGTPCARCRIRPRGKSSLCKECGVDAARIWLYGINVAQYEAMLAEQGGVCKICGLPPVGMRLAVDHDTDCCPGERSCGKCVRGLLHNKCNQGLGYFNDSPEALESAARYLREYRARGCQPET